jgi:chloride channel 3/4/5
MFQKHVQESLAGPDHPFAASPIRFLEAYWTLGSVRLRRSSTILCLQDMASSSAGTYPPGNQVGSSSSQNPLDDSDEDDPGAGYPGDHGLLSVDPFDDNSGDIVSFKRKQKRKAPASLSKFLSPFADSGTVLPSAAAAASSPRAGAPRLNGGRGYGQRPLEENGNSFNMETNLNHANDGSPLDWYVEGPGRRVGYEDMTAIDWIFEYTKERQRLRALYSSATGIIGYAQQMLDASQIWVVLILTGLAAGLVAAAIDIASDWLGDIKMGYCSAGVDGGRFYLNKYFCCWGYGEWSKCQDWVPWSAALHITSSGGKWIVEYIFFILYSVSCVKYMAIEILIMPTDCICTVCQCLGANLCHIRKAQWDTGDQDSLGRVRNSAFYGCLDVGH